MSVVELNNIQPPTSRLTRWLRMWKSDLTFSSKSVYILHWYICMICTSYWEKSAAVLAFGCCLGNLGPKTKFHKYFCSSNLSCVNHGYPTSYFSTPRVHRWWNIWPHDCFILYTLSRSLLVVSNLASFVGTIIYLNKIVSEIFYQEHISIKIGFMLPKTNQILSTINI